MTKVLSLADGKYEIYRHDDGRMESRRDGQPWRDLTGDHLVAHLIDAISEPPIVVAESLSLALHQLSAAVEATTDPTVASAIREAATQVRHALTHAADTPLCWIDSRGIPYGTVSDEQLLPLLQGAIRCLYDRNGWDI